MRYIWKTGEAVTIKCQGSTVKATIALASPNGKSLAVEFKAFHTKAGLWLNGAALMWDDEAETFRDLRSGIVMEVTQP